MTPVRCLYLLGDIVKPQGLEALEGIVLHSCLHKFSQKGTGSRQIKWLRVCPTLEPCGFWASPFAEATYAISTLLGQVCFFGAKSAILGLTSRARARQGRRLKVKIQLIFRRLLAVPGPCVPV